MTIQINDLTLEIAKLIVTSCERYNITADIKCGSVRVDARSIVGIMELIGHDVDLIIINGRTIDVLDLINQLYIQRKRKVKILYKEEK